MFHIVEILVITPIIDGLEHTIKSLRIEDLKVPNSLPMIFKSWSRLLVVARFILIFAFHECMSTTMFSGFTVPFVIRRFFACEKIMRKLPTTIACFTILLGVLDPGFIKPFVYSNRR